MTDGDKTVMLPRVARSYPPARPWTDDEFTEADGGAGVDVAAGLVSISFLTAALRRRARFWCGAAVLGLLLGVGLYIKFPPSYQATTSVLLTHAPTDIALDAMQTDQAMAQSRAVAALTVRNLGLQQSTSAFVSSYSTTVVTDRILLFTANAPSRAAALRQATGVAAGFLEFRANQLKSEQRLVVAALDNQISQAKNSLTALSSKLTAESHQPASTAQRATLHRLQQQHTAAVTALGTLQQVAQDSRASSQVDTDSQVNRSQVLDPAALSSHSKLKLSVIYVGPALIGALALAMGYVVIQALVSDRLRRRDDVAYALGAPVRLSVGAVRLRRFLPGRRGLAAAQSSDIQRIARHLRSKLPGDSGGAALAVVAVDRAEVAALALVSLALSAAKQGKRVVLADLSPGCHAARLLGNRNPGVSTVTAEGMQLTLAVPDRSDAVPVGPLPPIAAQGEPATPTAPVTEGLATAYASADLLLTLAELHPSLGAEHLSTWATRAAVVVTAGESTSTRINAVAEMIRFTGILLVSGVLVGADKNDESLGMTRPRPVPAKEGPESEEVISFPAR
jgi:capsular polysaccharide biosynthesis protein